MMLFANFIVQRLSQQEANNTKSHGNFLLPVGESVNISAIPRSDLSIMKYISAMLFLEQMSSLFKL